MSQKLKYNTEDFNIIQNKDTKIIYSFKSKDEKISANFFWESGDVQLRTIIFNLNTGLIVGILNIGYPFAFPKGDFVKPPKPDIIINSLIRCLNNGDYKELK